MIWFRFITIAANNSFLLIENTGTKSERSSLVLTPPKWGRKSPLGLLVSLALLLVVTLLLVVGVAVGRLTVALLLVVTLLLVA